MNLCLYSPLIQLHIKCQTYGIVTQCKIGTHHSAITCYFAFPKMNTEGKGHSSSCIVKDTTQHVDQILIEQDTSKEC